MFIQTEPTPDPATLKFLPGRAVLARGQKLSVHYKTDAENSPFVARLFAIPHVATVVCGGDFIIVTKDGGDWAQLKPRILGEIMEHFLAPAATAAEDSSSALPDPPAGAINGDRDLIDRVRSALRQVIDPELGYNIVDLGLIYDIAATANGTVRVVMTTTTPGCPATGYLQQGASDRARDVPGVAAAEVELTYDPPWTPERMSAEAKAHFGISDGGR